MTLTLTQLIEALEDVRAEVGGDVQVLSAHQPAWPLAENVGRPVVLYDEGDEMDGFADERAPVVDYTVEEDEPVVWLPLTGHPEGRSPYAPSAVFDSAYC